MHEPTGEVQPAIRGRGGAICARLEGQRWHLQHGPIDLIIEVDADAVVAAQAMHDCWTKFPQILPDLVAELPMLRRAAPPPPVADSPASQAGAQGPVARRMIGACAPFADQRFITPMAAVAGAVADELIGCFQRPGIRRAFINNGGDIAVHLAPGAHYRIGIWGLGAIDRRFILEDDMPVRGIATSGWRGRSFSLGIADAVTVLAQNAAAADAAATLIANAVDCDHAGIVRAPADRLKDDTDLGCRLVTVEVPPLPAAARSLAVSRGRAEAQRWRDAGCIHAAAILLQGTTAVVMPRAAPAAHGSLRAACA